MIGGTPGRKESLKSFAVPAVSTRRPTLSSLLSNPVSTLGAGITLPFLQWNAMQLAGKVARADYEIAVIDFRQTLYAQRSCTSTGEAGEAGDAAERGAIPL